MKYFLCRGPHSAKGSKKADELVFAWYNPPFMPWFLFRNEVLIPVAR